MHTRAENLRPKQTQAIGLLLTGKKLDDLCKDLKISRPTIWRWMHRDHRFQSELRQAQDALFAGALGELKSNLQKAVLKVAEMMDSKRDDVALRASQSLIEFNLRLRQAEQLEARIAALESTLARS